MAEKKYHLCSTCKHAKESAFNKAYYCGKCMNGCYYYRDTVSEAKSFTMQMDEIINSNKKLVGDLEHGYFYVDSGLCTTISKVIFNPPATIVYWSDNTKTVVKAQNGEPFDPEKGLAMAVMKKSFGNKGSYYNEVKKWCEPYLEEHEEETCNDVKDDLSELQIALDEFRTVAAELDFRKAIESLRDMAHKRGKFE